MSGTSLDGMDICLTEFSENAGKWNYKILAAETISYSEKWLENLKRAERSSGAALMELHEEYGIFIGETVNSFLEKNKIKKPVLISSHGHTIYHRPDAGYTFQLGDGKKIHALCKIPVVSDFRSGDVALGGQGAPLVPIGDKLLFGEYDLCLNLGGFANISFEKNNKRIAFDICPVNYVLNFLAKRTGKNFDENGKLSSSGKAIPGLIEKLNSLSFYQQPPPKSLGREWVEQNIFPLLDTKYKTEDLLCTFTEHIAQQLSYHCRKGKLLLTGGGTHNDFLVEQIKEKCKTEIIIPDQLTIDFKEALIFALLGLLRMKNEINILSSVTGAQRDSCGGELFS